MGLTAKRVLTVVVGVIVAGVMLLLGLWQMNSYQQSMTDVAAERAAQPPVPLAESVSSDGKVADIYGRRVTLSGNFMPERVLVGTQWPLRLAQAFRLDDGRIIAVVAGTTGPEATLIPSDGNAVDLSGIFTSGDAATSDPVPSDAPAGSMPSLRLQELVQAWPQPLIPGYVTLAEADATRLGLGPATPILPESQGSGMHQGYALQWWVFAAAAIAFSIVVARGYRAPAEVGTDAEPDVLEADTQ